MSENLKNNQIQTYNENIYQLCQIMQDMLIQKINVNFCENDV